MGIFFILKKFLYLIPNLKENLNKFMGRSQETFNKKAVRNKKEKKRKDKEAKMAARRENKKPATLDSMIAYVDEYGNFTDTPPDPSVKREVIKAEDIIIGIPKKESIEDMDPIRRGTVTYFNDDKGYGFIKDSETQDSIFVHISNTLEDIRENNVVKFEVAMGEKGPTAVKVEVERN